MKLTVSLEIHPAELALTLALLNRGTEMDNTQATDQVIADIRAKVNQETTLLAGFEAFISAHDQAFKDALNVARASGATDEQLAALTALNASIGSNVDALKGDLTARTPVDPAAPAPAEDPKPEAPAPAAPVAAMPGEPAPVANESSAA